MGFWVFSHFRFLCLFVRFMEDDISPPPSGGGPLPGPSGVRRYMYGTAYGTYYTVLRTVYAYIIRIIFRQGLSNVNFQRFVLELSFATPIFMGGLRGPSTGGGGMGAAHCMRIGKCE